MTKQMSSDVASKKMAFMRVIQPKISGLASYKISNKEYYSGGISLKTALKYYYTDVLC